MALSFLYCVADKIPPGFGDSLGLDGAEDVRQSSFEELFNAFTG